MTYRPAIPWRHLRATILAGMAVFAVSAGSGIAQGSETLADIRQQLAVLDVELKNLKRELSTTGSPQVGTIDGDLIARLDAIERELQRLTGQTEQLSLRVDRVVTDGTNRLGDIEFRLIELEGGDLGQLGSTPPLGGEAAPSAAAAPTQDNTGPELAVTEQSDFERARGALDQGSFREAADLFGAFAEAYPVGPLTGAAHFYRGEALRELGDMAPAARAYLESFSGAPDSDVAPLALLKLGQSLQSLGQAEEACITFNEVEVRFPQTDAAFDAIAEQRAMGCS